MSEEKKPQNPNDVAASFMLGQPALHIDWFYLSGAVDNVRIVIGEQINGTFIPRGHIIMNFEYFMQFSEYSQKFIQLCLEKQMKGEGVAGGGAMH